MYVGQSFAIVYIQCIVFYSLDALYFTTSHLYLIEVFEQLLHKKVDPIQRHEYIYLLLLLVIKVRLV